MQQRQSVCDLHMFLFPRLGTQPLYTTPTWVLCVQEVFATMMGGPPVETLSWGRVMRTKRKRRKRRRPGRRRASGREGRTGGKRGARRGGRLSSTRGKRRRRRRRRRMTKRKLSIAWIMRKRRARKIVVLVLGIVARVRLGMVGRVGMRM